jgi:hypothetical protein
MVAKCELHFLVQGSRQPGAHGVLCLSEGRGAGGPCGMRGCLSVGAHSRSTDVKHSHRTGTALQSVSQSDVQFTVSKGLLDKLKR